MRIELVLASLVPLALVACDNPLRGCPGDDTTLALGTGSSGVMLLNDGDVAPIVRGGQGGYHVDVAARGGPLPFEVQISTTLTIPSAPDSPEVGVGQAQRALANYDDDSCEGEFWGLRAVMIPQYSTPGAVCLMNGREGVIDVTVQTLDGDVLVEDTITVLLRHDAC